MIRAGFILNDIGDRWLGGVNYYRNLFSALDLLQKRELEPVVFIGKSAPESFERSLGAARVVRSEMLDRMRPSWVVRKVIARVLPERRDPMLYALLLRHKIDVVSHSHYGPIWRGGRIRTIGWIPDFQHLYYPDFFLPSEGERRNVEYGRVCRLCDRIILSSESVQSDLMKFAPDALSRSRVLRFVPDVNRAAPTISLADLQKKYDFQAPFFFLPNQFHIHKNHRVVIDALAELRKQGSDVTVISTGNTADYRRPDYFPTLMSHIRDLNLEGAFKIVGIVPYQDLMAFMHYSVAVLNPSLFEGWSTTVEEGKALGKRLLLSDIPVHREQNPDGGIFFNPADASGLAQEMLSVLHKAPPLVAPSDESYRAKRIDFARRYQEIVSELQLNSAAQPA